MKLTRASTLEERPIRWLWCGRVPLGQTTLIEGDPGVAKSSLTCMMASHVTRGAAWPDGGSCPQGTVVMFSGEDPNREVMKPRLVAAKADMEFMLLPEPSSAEDTKQFTIPDDVEALSQVIVGQRVKLMVFDPLEAFLSVQVDSYRNHHVRQALRKLEVLADKHAISIIIIRHLNKDQGKAAIYRGSGSVGIGAAARSILTVGKDPSTAGRFILASNKINWAKPRPAYAYTVEDYRYELASGEAIITNRIKWQGEVSADANDVINSENDPTAYGILQEAGELIRGLLKDGNVLKSEEVYRAGFKAGLPKPAIRKAAKLVGVHRFPGEGGESLWRLPGAEEQNLWEGLVGDAGDGEGKTN